MINVHVIDMIPSSNNIKDSYSASLQSGIYPHICLIYPCVSHFKLARARELAD